MLGALARRLFGSANDRYVKSLGPIVSAINELEPQLEAMSDDELRARTQQFKQQLADNIAATDLRLSETELKSLDEASKLPPEYPGWIFDRQNRDRFPGGAIT